MKMTKKMSCCFFFLFFFFFNACNIVSSKGTREEHHPFNSPRASCSFLSSASRSVLLCLLRTPRALMTSLLARAAEVSGRSFAGWRNSEWEREEVRKRKHSSTKWFNSVINKQNRLTRAASAVINMSLIDDQRKLTWQSTNNPGFFICINTISYSDSIKQLNTEVN